MFQILYVIYLFVFGFHFCSCFDDIWNSYEKSYADANREELVVANISSDGVFKSELKIKKWSTLSVGSTCYTVGFQDSKLEVLFTTLDSNTRFNITSKVIDINETISELTLFHHRTQGESEIILIVAIQGHPKLVWYKIKDYELIHFWSWPLQKNVTHMKVLKVDNEHKLLILNNDNDGNDLTQASADIHAFDLKLKPNHWFQQQPIHLSNPTKFSAVNSFEFDTYLSIPQKTLNLVLVYKFVDNLFIPYKNISSTSVDNIISFESGFKSFLGVDGLNPRLYQFTENGLVEDKGILNLGGLDFWIAIPVTTYRDEDIILAQRYLDHGTHKSFDVDIITYNGNAFEEHEDIPCTFFGETLSSLKCMVDDGSTTGIAGTTYISVEDKLGLLVERLDGNSILFMVNLTIKSLPHPAESEIKLLTKLRENLEEKLDSQEKRYEEIKSYNLHSSQKHSPNTKNATNNVSSDAPILKEGPSKLDTYKQEIEEIIIDVEKIKNIFDKISASETIFDKVIISGPVEIEGDITVKNMEVEKIKGAEASLLLNDIVRKNNIGLISGHKTFTDLLVDDIRFNNLNGVSSSDILSKHADPIVLNGDVTFTKTVHADNLLISSGLINDIDFENEVVDIRNQFEGPLEFEELHVNGLHTSKTNNLEMQSFVKSDDSSESLQKEQETVFIPNDLTVENINGESIDEFINQLCVKNIKCYIPGDTKISGNIIVTGSVTTDHLNNLKFPKEYILQDRKPFSNITGHKTFINNLVASQIRSRGIIDNMDTNNIITLSSYQEVPGKITFENIEVTEELKVHGSVKGEHIEKFLPNLTLEKAKLIKSNVNFKFVEVEGSIIIENNFNNNDFDTMLRDLVYKDNDNVMIKAQKAFPQGLTIRKNLQVQSNSFNNIPFDSIVTKDTEQVLNIDTLSGTINFENMYVTGLFGGRNITQLDQDTVKLTGEQFISSDLIFTDDIEAGSVEITETLNDLSSEEYLYMNGDRIIKDNLRFKDIQVENIFIEGNLNGAIREIDLEEFSRRALSITKDQDISGEYVIRASNVDDVNAERMNNVNYKSLFDNELMSWKVVEMLNKGKMKIGNLHLNGSLQIFQMNDKNMNEYLTKNEWFKFVGNNSETELLIDGDVYFDTLEINELSSVNFNEFVDELVLKNETNIEIDDTITFSNGITIKNLAEIKKLNGIYLENILRVQGSPEISGPLTIQGDVVFQNNFEIMENINHVPVKYILDSFNFSNESPVVKGDVIFNRLAHITDIVVNGYINDQKIDDILENIVYVNGDFVFDRDIKFQENVEVIGNLAVTNDINNIDLSEIVPRIVWTTKDSTIENSVRFTKSIDIHKELTLRSDLETTYLFGKDFNMLTEKAVFINKGLLEGNYTFEEVQIHNLLTTEFMNDIDMKTIIPLRTEQHIEHLEIEEFSVANNVKVGNLVNGVILEDEYKRTVMGNLDQEISTDIVFLNNVLVRQNLFTPKINNIEADKIVTTNTDQNLTAVYHFNGKSIFDRNLKVYDHLNGINLTSWRWHGVNILSPEEEYQTIKDDWNITKNLAFHENVDGEGLINGMDLEQVVKEVEEKKNFKYEAEQAIIEDFNNICKDVTYLYESTGRQIFKFKYFEELQHLELPNYVQSVHHFQYRGNRYLLINEDDCSSRLLVFNKTSFYPIKRLETGHIVQAVTINDGDFLYLATLSKSGLPYCHVEGTNVWKFEDSDLKVMVNVENQDTLQESVIPATFYGTYKNYVTEFKVDGSLKTVRKYRVWNIDEDNVAFMPRGLGTGLALRTGRKLIYLHRSDPVVEDEYDWDAEAVTKANFTEEYNGFIPGKNGGDIAVTRVGVKSARRTLLAVANHRKTSVKDRLDLIEIYGDPLTGEMFHEIPTYKPSSLISLEFNNGETMLVFIEDQRRLQVYEYKGIEGFKHRLSAKLQGTDLFLMHLPLEPYSNERKVLGVVNKNKVTLLEAVMIGNQIRDDLSCEYIN